MQTHARIDLVQPDVPREERGGSFPNRGIRLLSGVNLTSSVEDEGIGRFAADCGYRVFSRRFSRAISLIVSGIAVSNAAAGGIPVGIAVARQRLQHQETSTSMRNVSLSHHTSHHATSYHHFQPDGLGESLAPLRSTKLSFPESEVASDYV